MGKPEKSEEKYKIQKMKFFGVLALYAQANGESASKFQDAANDIKNVLDVTLEGLQKIADTLSKIDIPKVDIPEFKFEAPKIEIPDMADFKFEAPGIKVPDVAEYKFEAPEINVPDVEEYKFDDSELKEQLKNL